MRNIVGIILDKIVQVTGYGRDYTNNQDLKVAVDPTSKAVLVKLDGVNVTDHANLTNVTSNQHHTQDHASRHRSGGADAVFVWKQLVWYLDGTVVTGTRQGPTIKMPNASASWTIDDVVLLIDTAPTGAALIVDIQTSSDNSTYTTIFTTKPQISASGIEDSNGLVLSVSTIAANAYVRMDVSQVGSTVAGSDLTVIMMLKEYVS